MPDRDFHPKQGRYFLIMNEIADKLAEYPLPSNETRLLWAIMRRTWGFKGQAWALIKWDTLLKATKLSSSSLSYARHRLIDRNILHTKPDKAPKSLQYKINSKVSTWIETEDLKPYWPSKLVQPVEPKKQGKLVQPVEPSSFNQLNHLVQPVEPVPIKDKFKDISLNTQGECVCVDEKTTLFLNPENQVKEGAKIVLDCLNDLSGKEFSYSDSNLEPIVERLEDGASLEDCLTVCNLKWEDTTFQNQYYRPSTLFKKQNFENYLYSKGKRPKPSSKQEARRLRTAAILQRRQNEREKARQEEPPGEN